LNHTAYIALTALVINLVVAVVLTLAFRLARLPAGTDETAPAQYTADPDGTPGAAVPVTTMPTKTT
jgi:SSS family solute:Na+ symporter